MSHHCHIAVIEKGRTSFFDSYWGAVGIHLDFLSGPSTFRSIVDDAKPIETIYPDVAEAAVCFDADRKELLWYSIDDDDVLKKLTLREIFIDLLRPAWEGWSLQWEDEGPVGVAKRLHLPLELGDPSVSTTERAPESSWKPDEADAVGWWQSLMSVRWDERAPQHYRFRNTADGFLLNGPRWLDSLRNATTCRFPQETHIPDWTRQPRSGAFLDCKTRTLHHWAHNAPESSFLNALQAAWPGWTTSVHTSGLIRQAELAGLDTEPLRIPRKQGFRIVLEWLNKEDPRPGLEQSLKRLVEMLQSSET